jgi:hypothetical protein
MKRWRRGMAIALIAGIAALGLLQAVKTDLPEFLD